MKHVGIFRKIVTEASLYECRYGLKPNTVILGVQIYNTILRRFDSLVHYPTLKFEPEQLMGMKITVDFDREYVVGVCYVHDYADLFDENNNLGD